MNTLIVRGSVPENPDTLLIVEGSLDAIYCREAGVEDVVAQYCLVPNVYQLERLKLINPKRIVGLLDSDRAGRAAGEWFIKSLYPFFLSVEAIYCPQDSVDPWEYTELKEFLLEQGLLSGNTNNA